eukprot:14368040-Heterocapsa_arctica.AAC.1
MSAKHCIKQKTPEEVQEEESAIETQEYGKFAADNHEGKLQAEDQKGGQTELTHDGGQKQEELDTQITMISRYWRTKRKSEGLRKQIKEDPQIMRMNNTL